MTLDYVTIRRPILTLKGYSASKKILLGLVDSFNSKGLKMSNAGLAEILDVKPDYISDLLCELEAAGDVEIKNRQSRHRIILLREKLQSKEGLLRKKTGSKGVLLRSFSPSTSEKTPNVIKGTKEKHTCASRNSLCDETFQSFFDVYPRKVAKAEAEKSWAKLKPSPELVGQIIAAVERQKQTEQWLKDNGKYIPYPATWLNKRRWEDELPEPKRGEPGWLPDEAEAEAILKEAKAC